MADQVIIQPGKIIVDDIVAHSTVTTPTFQGNTINADKILANTLEGNLEITGEASTEDLTASSVTVNNTLTVLGNDTTLNGEVMETITSPTVRIAVAHGKWYNNANSYTTLTVIPDVNSGTVKTCYIVTPVSVVLNGVTWLYSDIDMTDTTKTYVIALQQIGSTIVYANLAYSFPTPTA